jgi:hypothetical protein
MAMTEPTDRSMPAVAITRAIPSATIATAAAWRSCTSSSVWTVRKLGVATAL